jgi:hypothetical protein
MRRVALITLVAAAASILLFRGSSTRAQEAPQSLANDYLRIYRGMLITYQPEFTVEGARMIQLSVAEANARRAGVLDPCAPEQESREYCSVSATGARFESGDFTWLLWYERVAGYSRTSQVRTVIAKFPRGAAPAQTSYAVFRYQGHWVLSGTYNAGYALSDRESAKIDNDESAWDAHMFFTPDIDYPVIAYPRRASAGRIAAVYAYYKADASDEITIEECESGCVYYHRFLLTGDFLEQASIDGSPTAASFF